jgi:hypothetical protein
MLRKRMESQVHLHEAQARRSEAKDPAQLVRAHAHPQEAVGGQQNCHAFFLDVRKRMIQSGGWAVRQVARGVDGKLWRVLRDLAVKSTSQS